MYLEIWKYKCLPLVKTPGGGGSETNIRIVLCG